MTEKPGNEVGEGPESSCYRGQCDDNNLLECVLVHARICTGRVPGELPHRDGTRELLNHLVIVAMDDKAYERCVVVHRHCLDFKVERVDFSAEKVFNSPKYLDMMWARLDFLRLVLEKGFDFVFSAFYESEWIFMDLFSCTCDATS
ncbi:uncharacterized protein At4g15970-like [Zingiber officinale]|uniref:uncharacterized protein At4g15970-like n=1 Tax=Zingiber officinale TaxID=94328 RepID=UPI001C4D9F01|nr:uncharacterized protein At4g15970-like [Zingiber officinale]